MTIYNIPEVVGISLPQAATPKNILSEFSAAGIWPFYRRMFEDLDFATFRVTVRLG
jgi:hypothetical protein